MKTYQKTDYTRVFLHFALFIALVFLRFTLPNGEKVTCAVTRGMADFTNNRAQILCESALHPEEIDEEEEARLLEEAKLELNKKQSEKDYAIWQLSLNKAINNLKIKNKQKNINL